MGNTVSLSDICGNFRTPFSLTDLTEPYQPRNIEFPPTVSKGGKKRHFQASWFDKYQWLHYDCHLDAAFCFICIKANEKKALSASKAEDAFTKKGFRNWKKALTDGFPFHETSQAQGEATIRIDDTSSVTYGKVDASMSEVFSYEQEQNRKMLTRILSNVRYLGALSIQTHFGH